MSRRASDAMCIHHAMLLSICLLLASLPAGLCASFPDAFVVNWASSNVRILNAGQELQLSLTPSSGSGFASKQSFLLGRIDMQIKLVPGNSAGTVTAYYLSSETSNHDELDFEFLGNVTGQPYILQTNVYANGIGEREQRIYLWFDPSATFHTYSVVWTQKHILFLVDGTPIRVYANNQAVGVPYPNKQPMKVFSSIWNGDEWATEGGRIKIDWSHAPFVAAYRNFQVTSNTQVTAASSALNTAKLAWVKRNYMVYNYCTDRARNPTAPPECSREF